MTDEKDPLDVDWYFKNAWELAWNWKDRWAMMDFSDVV